MLFYTTSKVRAHLFIVLMVLLTFITSTAHAESLARSVPQSASLISGELTLENGEVIDFSVLDGGMLKVRDRELGTYYGIVPSLNRSTESLDGWLEKDADRIELTIFEIVEIAPGAEALKEVRRDAFQKSDGFLPLSSPGLREITITDVSIVALSEDDLKSRQALARQGFFKIGSCCVQCGNIEACGCRVSMSCGSCCSGTCCGGGPI